jgi:phosphatidylglycerol:prolipoprotein diacylglycerol transferase
MNWRTAAHFIFETLGYAIGFRLYLRARRKHGDFLPTEARTWIVVAAILGAALGSKLLFWLENPARTLQHAGDLAYLISGKTIVGGLLGGTLAVEWTKSRLGIARRTGDLFAIPMAIGIAIGRIGCFFAGLPDDTYGIPSNLPWAVDFGDGIPRHPTQLYETVAMLILAAWLHWQASAGSSSRPEGALYRYFLAAYLAWRLSVDFLKPGVPFAGLTMIQWACAAALTWYITHPIHQLEAAHG